jgi:hypothetical protein
VWGPLRRDRRHRAGARPAESYDGGRYRFDTPIVLDHGGTFGYTARVIPRNDLLTAVAELRSWPWPEAPAQ